MLLLFLLVYVQRLLQSRAETSGTLSTAVTERMQTLTRLKDDLEKVNMEITLLQAKNLRCRVQQNNADLPQVSLVLVCQSVCLLITASASGSRPSSVRV